MTKVLIVEDEPAIARTLARKLKQKNLDCLCVDTVSGAKSAIEDFCPDVIFLDYVLKDGRSKELVESSMLTKQHRVFLMSAFMDDLEKEDFSNLDVTYLKKPFKNLNAIIDEI